MSIAAPTFSAEAQKQNSFLGKSSNMTSPLSHDDHVNPYDGHMNPYDSHMSPYDDPYGSPNKTGSSDNECAVVDQEALIEDPFYNFDEMGQSSSAVLDPNNPNSIPFTDNFFTDTSCMSPEGNFDPDLFNSILSSGDDLLARLESTSSNVSEGVASFELPLDDGQQWEDGDREGPPRLTESPQTDGEPYDPFEDFIRIRALSTIIEDQGEGRGEEQSEEEEEEDEYVHLNEVQTAVANLRSPPLVEGGVAPVLNTSDKFTDSGDDEPGPSIPPRSTSLRGHELGGHELPPRVAEEAENRVQVEVEGAEALQLSQVRGLSPDGREGVVTPVNSEDIGTTVRRDRVETPENSGTPMSREDVRTPVNREDNIGTPVNREDNGTPISREGARTPVSRGDIGTPVPVEGGEEIPPLSPAGGLKDETSTADIEGGVAGVAVEHGLQLVISPPPEEENTPTADSTPDLDSNTTPASNLDTSAAPHVDSTTPNLDTTLTGSATSDLDTNMTPPTASNLDAVAASSTSPIASNLESIAASQTSPTASNLDIIEASRTSPAHVCPVQSDLDRSMRMAAVASATAARLASNLEKSPVRRTSSNNNSPILRSKSPHTPNMSRRPSSEMLVLQPLSPEHGDDLNERYEFLRRTLSHSQRRYSQRGRRPREKREGAKVPNGGVTGEGRSGGGVANGVIANGSVPRSGLERSMSNRDYKQRKTIGNLRDIVRRSEGQAPPPAPPPEEEDDMVAHVDQHGRIYYMDHNNRTIAFNRTATPGAPSPQQEVQTRREMLDRRYQSLQRSFRRSERPSVTQRKSAAVPGSEASGVGRGSRGGASAGLRTDNNSLSMTLAEAEEMARGLSNKKGRGFSGRWFFSKKRKSSTSSPTGHTGSSSSPPSSVEGSPQPEGGASDSSLSRSSGSDNQNEIAAMITAAASGERELTPASIQSAEFESGTEEDVFQRTLGVSSPERRSEVGSEVTSEPSTPDERSEVTSQSSTPDQRSEVAPEPRPSQGEVGLTPSSSSPGAEGGLRDRQTSIVHSSNLTTVDQVAAARARATAKRKSRHRLNTDEITNEERTEPSNQTVEIPVASQDTLNRHSQILISDIPATPTHTASSPSRERPSEKKVGSGAVSRGSRRKSKRSAKNLATSPALRFIIRKDLYSFLSSAGTAGEEFFANRALMELVQRIRSNNSLFEKYEHSHHMVEALNKFSDLHADLPKGWEKKLNKQGKIFFIDHEHELTTFLDPRLPLPDTPYSFNPTFIPQQMLAKPSIRPHHTVITNTAPTIVEPENTMATLASPTSVTAPESGLSPPSNGLASNRLSVLSTTSTTSVEVTPIAYEEQVVAFFRQRNVAELIGQRYARGVRPQFQAVIDAIKNTGTSALERIQMSGSIATYELALVMSLFEEEISRMRPTPEGTTPPEPQIQPTPATPPADVTPPTPSASDVVGKSTLQRRKEAFPIKLQNFKMMMARLKFVQGSRVKYNIRRDHLLEDAYEHIMKSDIKLLQMKRLNVTFKGEEGLDYGGPSREFFFLLSREIFNPYYGLFEYSANDTYTIQISPTSSFIHNCQDWFRFAGRVMGLVIVQGFLLDVFCTRTVYKSILGRHSSMKDLEALEPDFHNSLLWIRDNDPEPLDLTFTVEEEAFGQLNSHELKPGGNDVPVTEDNKDEYVDLMVRWRLDRGVAKQMNAFKKGFSEIMPVNLLSNFDAQELEFLTAGTLEIDVEDWKSHTEYRNGYHAAHPVVIWFWQAVESFDNEERLRLLQFVTGTSSVPIAGFKALRGSNGPKKFTIDYYNDVQAFPRSHTCFNRVDLPPYPSCEVLSNKLRFAVMEGGGFGIE